MEWWFWTNYSIQNLTEFRNTILTPCWLETKIRKQNQKHVISSPRFYFFFYVSNIYFVTFTQCSKAKSLSSLTTLMLNVTSTFKQTNVSQQILRKLWNILSFFCAFAHVFDFFCQKYGVNLKWQQNSREMSNKSYSIGKLFNACELISRQRRPNS